MTDSLILKTCIISDKANHESMVCTMMNLYVKEVICFEWHTSCLSRMPTLCYTGNLRVPINRTRRAINLVSSEFVKILNKYLDCS